jgi:hypothetical protein
MDFLLRLEWRWSDIFRGGFDCANLGRWALLERVARKIARADGAEIEW